MPDRPDDTPDDTDNTGNGQRRGMRVAVERAIGELRSGRMVMVRSGGDAVLMLSAEICTPAKLAEISRLGGGEPALALTRHRATVLHIPPKTDPVLVRITPDMPAGTVARIADATSDLASPMKGPFRPSSMPAHAGHGVALRLLKLARLLPAAVVSAPFGAQAATAVLDTDNLLEVADSDIEGYEAGAALALELVAAAPVPLEAAENARILAFRPDDGGIEHLAIVVGDPVPHDPVLVRLHSECFTGDLLGSLKCDCGDQLRGAIAEIAGEGCGVLLYLAQEGRGIGLINKLRAYSLQDQGFDTVDANERLGFDADERIFLPAAEMLKRLGFRRIRLMTNNPDKVSGLTAQGIEVVERVAHAFPANGHNEFYLMTKKKRSGHYL